MAKNNFRGMGGMGNMNNLVAQAQKMQRDMTLAQEKVNELRLEGTAGGDKVKIVLGGDHKIYGVEIAPEVCDPDDTEMLADLIIAAYNNAKEQYDAKYDEIMGKATGGIKLPFSF